VHLVPATHTNDRATLRDAGTLAHLDRIERALSADERTAMRKYFAALLPSERSLFAATLLMLPIADAVAVVRGKLSALPAPPAPMRPNAPSSAATGTAEASPNHTVSTLARKRPRSATSGSDAAPEAITAPDTAVSDLPGVVQPTIERNAHTHLAEIESALAPEERAVMHTLFSDLSPNDREAWLDKLLSASVTDGTGMLRAAIQGATTELASDKPNPGNLYQKRTTASAARVAAIGSESDAGQEADGRDAGGNELGSRDDLDDRDELGSRDDPDDRDDLADGGEPTAHELETSAGARPADAPQPTTSPPPAIATGAGLPTLDAGSLAHFHAIVDALTLAEKMRANELAAQRPAAELRRWYADLIQLSVPEAIAKIRAELARSDSDSESINKGDVP
jgi:hypothetical protein